MVFWFGKKPDVAELEKKRDIKGLIKALSYKKDEKFRTAAERAIDSVDDPMVEWLKGAESFSDPCSRVRSDAAKALGRIGDSRAVKPLTLALNDPRGDVRSSAAAALKKMGNR